MDRLLAFPDGRGDIGLSVSHRRLKGPRRLGVIGLMKGLADVEYNIWLHQTHGQPARYIGNYISP